MKEYISTKPRHQRGQRSLQSGQDVFMLAGDFAESVSLCSDIISQLILVSFSKQTSVFWSFLDCLARCFVKIPTRMDEGMDLSGKKIFVFLILENPLCT